VSPINISVHATDPAVRTALLCSPRAGECLPAMERLAKAGIRMNCQIVACPGVNDGPALEKSLYDLAAYWPGLGSIALVPVGLTGHREGLYPLKTYTRDTAAALIDQEVKDLIDSAYADCERILTQRRHELEVVARYLLDHETMEAETFAKVFDDPEAEELTPYRDVQP